ncbi:MAG: hypothetical protein ACTSWN_16690 [Promethearchaeota archaeon]
MKEKLQLKKQVLKHEKKNRIRKENFRKYREKNKVFRKTAAEKRSTHRERSRGKHRDVPVMVSRCR